MILKILLTYRQTYKVFQSYGHLNMQEVIKTQVKENVSDFTAGNYTGLEN
jgi:hypothetical protein